MFSTFNHCGRLITVRCLHALPDQDHLDLSVVWTEAEAGSDEPGARLKFHESAFMQRLMLLQSPGSSSVAGATSVGKSVPPKNLQALRVVAGGSVSSAACPHEPMACVVLGPPLKMAAGSFWICRLDLAARNAQVVGCFDIPLGAPTTSRGCAAHVLDGPSVLLRFHARQDHDGPSKARILTASRPEKITRGATLARGVDSGAACTWEVVEQLLPVADAETVCGVAVMPSRLAILLAPSTSTADVGPVKISSSDSTSSPADVGSAAKRRRLASAHTSAVGASQSLTAATSCSTAARWCVCGGGSRDASDDWRTCADADDLQATLPARMFYAAQLGRGRGDGEALREGSLCLRPGVGLALGVSKDGRRILWFQDGRLRFSALFVQGRSDANACGMRRVMAVAVTGMDSAIVAVECGGGLEVRLFAVGGAQALGMPGDDAEEDEQGRCIPLEIMSRGGGGKGKGKAKARGSREPAVWSRDSIHAVLVDDFAGTCYEQMAIAVHSARQLKRRIRRVQEKRATASGDDKKEKDDGEGDGAAAGLQLHVGETWADPWTWSQPGKKKSINHSAQHRVRDDDAAVLVEPGDRYKLFVADPRVAFIGAEEDVAFGATIDVDALPFAETGIPALAVASARTSSCSVTGEPCARVRAAGHMFAFAPASVDDADGDSGASKVQAGTNAEGKEDTTTGKKKQKKKKKKKKLKNGKKRARETTAAGGASKDGHNVGDGQTGDAEPSAVGTNVKKHKSEGRSVSSTDVVDSGDTLELVVASLRTRCVAGRQRAEAAEHRAVAKWHLLCNSLRLLPECLLHHAGAGAGASEKRPAEADTSEEAQQQQQGHRRLETGNRGLVSFISGSSSRVRAKSRTRAKPRASSPAEARGGGKGKERQRGSAASSTSSSPPQGGTGSSSTAAPKAKKARVRTKRRSRLLGSKKLKRKRKQVAPPSNSTSEAARAAAAVAASKSSSSGKGATASKAATDASSVSAVPPPKVSSASSLPKLAHVRMQRHHVVEPGQVELDLELDISLRTLRHKLALSGAHPRATLSVSLLAESVPSRQLGGFHRRAGLPLHAFETTSSVARLEWAAQTTAPLASSHVAASAAAAAPPVASSELWTGAGTGDVVTSPASPEHARVHLHAVGRLGVDVPAPRHSVRIYVLLACRGRRSEGIAAGAGVGNDSSATVAVPVTSFVVAPGDFLCGGVMRDVDATKHQGSSAGKVTLQLGPSAALLLMARRRRPLGLSLAPSGVADAVQRHRMELARQTRQMDSSSSPSSPPSLSSLSARLVSPTNHGGNSTAHAGTSTLHGHLGPPLSPWGVVHRLVLAARRGGDNDDQQDKIVPLAGGGASLLCRVRGRTSMRLLGNTHRLLGALPDGSVALPAYCTPWAIDALTSLIEAMRQEHRLLFDLYNDLDSTAVVVSPHSRRSVVVRAAGGRRKRRRRNDDDDDDGATYDADDAVALLKLQAATDEAMAVAARAFQHGSEVVQRMRELLLV